MKPESITPCSAQPTANTIHALMRAKRTLRLLSDCNSALVRSENETALLAHVCRLIVEVGGYRLVWIGYARHDAAKQVEPVAQWGFSQDYIDQLNITWADTERGRGPTGMAIRSGQTQLVRDICREPRFVPWRANATAHGFASSLALPLIRADENFGALNIYAENDDAFDQEEIQLLEELAGNLAYGISAFHLREERNNALRDAHKQDRICRAVVEQSMEGILIVGFDGFIRMSNPACARMTGHSEEALRQCRINDLVVSEMDSLLSSLLTEHERGVWELECVRQEGTRFPVEVRAYPMALPGAQGEERAVLCVVNDITQRKQDEAEKTFLQKQALHNARLASVGVMVAGVVHEVNNPNNAILFNSSLLVHAWKDMEIILNEYFWENGDFSLGGLPFTEMRHRLPALMEGITEHAKRIQGIINNMQYISRGGPEAGAEALDVLATLEKTVALLHTQICQRTLSLTLTSNGPLPLVQGHRQQLEQVFTNVILNALQSLSNKAQAVHIKVTGPTPERDKLLVTVRDEGGGIAEEYRKRLTEPFFSTKLREGGSGLGLFISNRIVENHGGELSFTSRLGEGTTVSILLPTAQES